MSNQHPAIFRRHKLNPILTAADWPYPVNSVFDTGATLIADGTALLLCRVEDRRGHSYLCAARSANVLDDWKIDSEPTLYPDPEHFPEEPYERQGNVDNAIFPCGYAIAPDGDTLHLYYGAADSSIALATGSSRTMLKWLGQNG